MTPRNPVEESSESIEELASLVAELNQHTAHLRGEIARLIDLMANEHEARRQDRNE